MKKFFAKLLGISTSILNFYLPIFKELIATGVADLLPIALEIVASLANAKITGGKKREMAVNRLKDAAVKKGIEASESLIRYTVESAVNKMKIDLKDE